MISQYPAILHPLGYPEKFENDMLPISNFSWDMGAILHPLGYPEQFGNDILEMCQNDCVSYF